MSTYYNFIIDETYIFTGKSKRSYVYFPMLYILLLLSRGHQTMTVMSQVVVFGWTLESESEIYNIGKET